MPRGGGATRRDGGGVQNMGGKLGVEEFKHGGLHPHNHGDVGFKAINLCKYG